MADLDIEPKCKQLDQILGKYYASLNADYYPNNDTTKPGKFAAWVDENGYDDDALDNEVNEEKINQSQVFEFDDNFPLTNTYNDDKTKLIEIAKIIKYCYNNGKPPAIENNTNTNNNNNDNNDSNINNKDDDEDDDIYIPKTDEDNDDININNDDDDESDNISDELAQELLTKICIHRGSITDLRIGAIVNAANNGLWAGAGVCGAIFRAAGYMELQSECDAITEKYGSVPTGQSVLTNGCRLYADHCIHSVGPTSQDNEALVSCYVTALDLCIVHNVRSIAFPCISTGIFGFSKQIACPLALKAVKKWLIKAKTTKYSVYVKELAEKAAKEAEEAIKRKKNKYKWSSRWNDDDDDNGNDEVDLNEWNDDDDNKNKKTDKTKNDDDNDTQMTDKNDENDKSDKNDDADKNDKNDNDDKKIDEKEKKEEPKKEDEAKEKEEKETVNDNDGDNGNDEMVFDRIDDIIFCCFDMGNWSLYQEQTPHVFRSNDDDYSYLWKTKLKKRKQQSKNKKKNDKNDKSNVEMVDDDHNE